MYIAPDTTIKILHNVPLDRSYENTVQYPTADAQYDAFNQYAKYTLDKQTYQRANIGTLRVQLTYENLYDCNYMMFRNTAFENKWFYAFITGVSYISNTVSEIYYQLDVMQTRCYDYSFLPSFVQRRHSTDDTLYGNTQPEGLELGSEYYANTNQVISGGDYINYIVLSSDIPSTDISTLSGSWRVHNALINNVYTGLYAFGTTSTQSMQTYLQAIIDEGKEGSVVALYMAPTGNARNEKEVTIKRNATLNGYQPRNNKLYTSPFNRIMVTNNEGITNALKYEYFDGDPKFRLTETSFPQAASRVVPENYHAGTTQVDQSVVYTNYPICGFAGDTFKAWFATNKNQYAASMAIIGRTYDANRAIQQNNFAMAQRSAQAGLASSQASVDTALSNAQGSLEVQSGNALLTGSLGLIGNGVSGIGSAISGDLGGVLESLGGMTNNVANQAATQASINQQRQNAQATAATGLANAQRSYSTAMKNAATQQASAQLSALTSKQNAIDQMMAKKQDIMNTPDSAHGNGLCDALNYADNNAHINIIQQSITREYAERIDSYFDMFGYAQNRLYTASELNNRLNRPHYTYIRTNGCNIIGKFDQSDIATIKGIYDNGITIWDTLEDIGHYELNNRPE